MVKTHRELDADITISTYSVPAKVAAARGLVRVDPDTGKCSSSTTGPAAPEFTGAEPFKSSVAQASVVCRHSRQTVAHHWLACRHHWRQAFIPVPLNTLSAWYLAIWHPEIPFTVMEKPSGATLEGMAHASRNATPEAPFEASMGIYVFNRDVLVSLLGEPANVADDSAIHIGPDIIPKALREDYRVVSHHFTNYFRVSSLRLSV